MKRVASWLFALSMLCSASAFAITIDARVSPYNQVNAANGVGIGSIYEVRQPAMLALVGAYRSANGLTSIPINSQVQIVYKDGSKEKAVVTCLAGSPCVQPVPGTQQAAGGGGGGGGGDPGGGGGGGGGGGCVGSCGGGTGGTGGGTGTVHVGDPKPVLP